MSIDDDSPTEQGRLLSSQWRQTPSTKFSLLVMSETGVFTYALPNEGEVTIGRGEKCDVHIADAKASRVHLILHVGSTVEVVDQGSTNGTKVGDRPIAPHARVPLAVGDLIAIGTTVLTLKRARTQRPPARVYSQIAFHGRVERERTRAGAAKDFAIVQLRFGADASDAQGAARLGADVAFVQRLEMTLADILRFSDVVASYVPGEYVVLLPETAPDVASSVVTQLRTELRAQKVAALVGVACHPRDGATLDVLISEATDDLTEERDAPTSQLDRGAMNRLAPMIDRIAAGRINVLILGETGVGKEVLARTLHVRSTRALGPMVCINCAALSEALLESELFGHEKGAFTGALQAKAGLLESANGGTVFLDEVGEMPLALQAKLLRVLEQREVVRVGSLRPRAIDVRFLAATNRDLEEEIRLGRFRQDLFYRLNGISLTLPPLRERVDEIEGLANAFAQQAAEVAQQAAPVITRPVLALLKRYAWPGNIRELRNVMERAVVLSTDGTITLEHMPTEVMGPVLPLADLPLPARGSMRPPYATLPPGVTDGVEVTTTSTDALFRPGMTDRERVVAALEACNGNQTRAAQILGISRGTLITRIDDYALPRPRKK